MTIEIQKSLHLPDVSPKHKGAASVMLHQRRRPSGGVTIVPQHTRMVDKKQENTKSDYSTIEKKVEALKSSSLGDKTLEPKENNTSLVFKEGASIKNTGGWETIKDKPWQSTYLGKNIKKFSISYKKNTIVLSKPTGKEFHAEGLGLSDNKNNVSAESFDDFVRCFYDPKNNAIGMRTPYVQGLAENNMQWNNDLRVKAFDIQYTIAHRLLKKDPTLKIVMNVTNSDVGPTETFNYGYLNNPEKRTITKEGK